MPLAPDRFVDWMSGHTANDKKHGRTVYRYHPRSDEHSKTLCRMVLEDLLEACPPLREHVETRVVVGKINAALTFPSGKAKNLDLAVGTPADPIPVSADPPLMVSGKIGQGDHTVDGQGPFNSKLRLRVSLRDCGIRVSRVAWINAVTPSK